jgi:hypothetical protein
MKTKTNHGVRSPMTGNTPSVKMPSLTGSGGGTVIQGSSPKSAPIQSPLNAPAKPGKK